MKKSKYKNIYNYALSLGFRINYIKSINNKSFYKFTIYRNEFQYNISNFTLNDIKKDIKNIYNNLDKSIIEKDKEIFNKLNYLLNDYSKSFYNTGGNNIELNNLKKYLFLNQDNELRGLELLKEKLKKFDYTAIFSDSYSTSNYWDYESKEINILINLLGNLYEDIINDFVNKFNINESGTKFFIKK